MIKVINVISDTNIGGAGKCVLTYLREYDRKNVVAKVVIPKGSLLKPEIEKLGVEYFEVEGMADKSMDFKIIKILKKYFQDENPEVVHTHASMSAKIAARLAGVKSLVYTRHCVYPPKAYLKRGPGRLLNRMVNHYLSDRIIAVAEAAKDNLTDTGISDKRISVVLNGVEKLTELTESEKTRIKAQYGIKENEFTVGIVARLEEVKGHEYFIEAAKIIADRKLPVKFLIAGTGTREPILKQKVQSLGLEDTVIFAGFVKDVTGIMNIIDINANASFGTEATSLSLLEGMSLGTPAVVTEFGGNPGVIKDGQNGFLVPIKNPEKMAEAIGKIVQDKELYDKLKTRSKKMFESTFTSKVNARNIEKIYYELAGKKDLGLKEVK